METTKVPRARDGLIFSKLETSPHAFRSSLSPQKMISAIASTPLQKAPAGNESTIAYPIGWGVNRMKGIYPTHKVCPVQMHK
jgi:hypothetical protein